MGENLIGSDTSMRRLSLQTLGDALLSLHPLSPSDFTKAVREAVFSDSSSSKHVPTTFPLLTRQDRRDLKGTNVTYFRERNIRSKRVRTRTRARRPGTRARAGKRTFERNRMSTCSPPERHSVGKNKNEENDCQSGANTAKRSGSSSRNA